MDFAYQTRPTPVLRPFIKSFAVVEFATPVRDSHLPHTRAVAAFSLQGECVIDDKYVAPAAALIEARNLADVTNVAESHPALQYSANVEISAWGTPAQIVVGASASADVASSASAP